MKRIALAMVALIALALLGWYFLPKPDLLPPEASFSQVVLDRNGKVLFLTLSADGKYRLPVKLGELSASLVQATLEMEDRRFFSHHGADGWAVARAGWGVVSGQRLGGGSTLTMQYARLRWGLNTRTFWGKAVQMFRAIQLERHYNKTQILESYFTFAPYGGNVEGASAASLLWCGKPASSLTLREAVALSVIPQSPAARRPREQGSPSAARAQARLMARLREVRGEAPQALDAEFHLAPAGKVPRYAQHFVRRELGFAQREGGSTATTLDFAQQQTMEDGITSFLTREHSRGLRNAAAILVHVPSRQVRGYVGSAGFLNESIHGQVDGVKARRSPGSALKPFIYALALDAGLIQPATLLDDAPRRFAGYNPENSDRGFLGPIPAADALRRSRNVPAVELAARLPDGGLDAFLRRSGVQLSRPPGAYGLSLALGGAEVSLEDLAHLYTGLAIAARRLPQGVSRDGNLISPAAAWLTLDALRGGGAPSGLSWKTGTSHGFRDAWACGVNGDWVLCVWVGNFDGKPMSGLFARDTAAPLLFQLVTRLRLGSAPIARPAAIVDVGLCAISGELAGPHCSQVRGPFIAGVSPISTCGVHREIIAETGETKVREFWPAHRLEQFRRAGLPRAEARALKSDARDAAPPRIVSPQPAITYVLRPGVDGKNSIPLEARAGASVREIHWFSNRQYIGVSTPSQPIFWKPAPGHWKLDAVDDTGRSATVAVNVSVE